MKTSERGRKNGGRGEGKFGGFFVLHECVTSNGRTVSCPNHDRRTSERITSVSKNVRERERKEDGEREAEGEEEIRERESGDEKW